jgi:hypothetical protein
VLGDGTSQWQVTRPKSDSKTLVVSGCSEDALMRCLMISGGSIASVLLTPCIPLWGLGLWGSKPVPESLNEMKG